MGILSFAKILKYGCLAAIGLAAAIAAIAALSTPAAAQGGGENRETFKSWDTDNLAAGGYGAKNYRIPFHSYGYSESVPAIPCFRPGSYWDAVNRVTLVNHLREQDGITGSCPSGYSQVTHACRYAYSYTTYNYETHGIDTHNIVSYSPSFSTRCPTKLYYDHISRGNKNASGTRVLLTARGIRLCRNKTADGLFWTGNYYLSANCAYRITVSVLKHQACRGAVADAFFQTGGSTGAVNDFPVLDYDNDKWSVEDGTGERSKGCVAFVQNQDRLLTSVVATGHYLVEEGGSIVLKSNTDDPLPSRVTSRSAAVYGLWRQKGTDYEITQLRKIGYGRFGRVYQATLDSSSAYNTRVDTRTSLAMAAGLSRSLVYPWSRYTGLGSNQGTLVCTSQGADRCEKRPNNANIWVLWTTGTVFRTSRNAESGSLHLSAAQDSGGDWCPAGWHPRGQDGEYLIGNSTGRTLSSIKTPAVTRQADAYWCRSDVRYRLKFVAQQHTCAGGVACAGPSGVALPAAGSSFGSYGRKNCYKTMTGYDSTAAECVYAFPLPECDPDPDNGSDTDWREFTVAEVANIGVVGEPFIVDEGAFCGTNINPPDLAGFDADPCVTVRVSAFENRPVGSNAEPGVPVADRTVAVSDAVPVYDLDVSAPFSRTASPPRDDTAGTGDPSGCADGEEERTDHGTRANASDAVLPAGSIEREGGTAVSDPSRPHAAPLPLPLSSSASNTAAPPSDYDADNSYGGARANMAHRYASAIAENTCAAKKAEAELVLAVLEAREASFVKWLEDYKDDADANRTKFAAHSPVSSGASGLSALWAADIATERTRAAAALAAAYGDLSAALVAAKTAYDTATDQTRNLASTTADDRATLVLPTSSSGCVAHYDAEIARLKKLFADAEAAVLGTGASGISEEEAAVKNNAPKVWARPAIATTGVTVTGARQSHRITNDGGQEEQYDCTGQGDSRTCKTRTVTTYTCSGYSYTRSGTTRGSYTPKSRTANSNGVLIETSGTTTRRNTSFSAVYSSPQGSYKSTDPSSEQTCPQGTVTGTTQTRNEANVRGSEGTITAWPSIEKPDKPTAIYDTATPPAFLLEPATLLGRYHPDHTDRAKLTHNVALERTKAANSLGTLTNRNSAATRTPDSYASASVPATQNIPTAAATTLRGNVKSKAESYRTAYTGAYNRANAFARLDMGGVGSQQQARWSNFHWAYDTDTLAWGDYTQNTTTDTTLADGTVIQGQPGCALFTVASDGTVTVSATRLDYETSRYGIGSTFTVRTAEQRECKVRRTRTPRLILRYEPPTAASIRPWRACPSALTVATRPCGTDSHSSRQGSYYDTDFQPSPTAELFKIYPTRSASEAGEAEILQVRISLADSPPVLCYQPGEALVAHVGAKGIDAVNKAVFRGASGFAGGNKKHCFKHPTPAQLGSPPRTSPQPAFAFFDDTAHSAMASVTAVWQQPSPKIVSKLGSTDHLKMMTDSVSLMASTAVAYNDAARTSSF